MAEPGPKLSAITFDDLSVGDRWGPFEERVDRELSDGLRGEVGAPAPGSLAPTGVYPALFLRAFRRAMGGIPPGGVLARAGVEVVAELAAEADVAITVRIADKHVKRGRPRVRVEFSVRDADGEEVARGHHTIVWATAEDLAREVGAG